MSCSSPFTFTAAGGTSTVQWSSATTYSGKTSIPGYSSKLCLTIPSYYSCTFGVDCCCTSIPFVGKVCFCPCCGTQTMKTCFSVTLWPELTFTCSAGSTFAFVTSEDLVFSLTPTGCDPATAVTESIEMTAIFVSLSVNGVGIPINVPTNLSVSSTQASDGSVEFAATIAFPDTVVTSGSYGGVSYSIDPYFLMCANPSNGVGYLNIVLPCDLSYDAGSYSISWLGETWDFDLGTWSCSVSVTCPIIGVD
jgi:hypothetical protein